MSDNKKLILIDGHSLMHRAFHAVPQTLATKAGEPTNAVYGFTSMLLKVWREERPDYLAVTFDVGKTFRHEEYPEYKAHRAKMDDDLRVQFDRALEILGALNIPVYTAERYEADDVLGTLARQAGEADIDTLIVTSDSDTFQLIDEHTRVLTPGRRWEDTRIYDEKAVKERYGLTPRQIIDFKGLKGDSSDNIPGVRGVGEKTATKLLQEYSSIEEIYARLDEVAERYRKKLEPGKDAAFQSKHLVTIVTDVPGVQLDVDKCRVGDFVREQAVEVFSELEFRSLLRRLDELPGAGLKPVATTAEQETRVIIVKTEAELAALAARLEGAEEFAFDTETTSEDPLTAQLVGISLSIEEGEGYYIPVGHGAVATGQIFMFKGAEEMPDKNGQLPLAKVLAALQPAFANPQIAKHAHNAKYDYAVLTSAGLTINGLGVDTMLAAWLLNPESRALGLKALALNRLGVEMTPLTALIGKGKEQITMAQVPIEDAAPYAAADADMTLRLAHTFVPELEEREQYGLLKDMEMPLIPIMARMEQRGVTLDVNYLREMSRDLQGRIHELEKEIHEEVGYEFNINSTQQLSDALFKKLQLPTKGLKKTKSGHYSTAAGVLEQFVGQHAVIDLILRQRGLTKLLSTYVDALPKLVNPRTRRVHTSYHQTGTSTGRVSSSDPNLQNIPIRTEEGRKVRRAFVAPPGHVLLRADYSQIELRILAHISEDEGLIDAFQQGIDVHAATAAATYNVPLEEVTYDQRRIAKITNFAISYGVSAFGLAQQTDMTKTEAGEFIKTYFEKYPRVRDYIEDTKKLACEQGYVETLWGRRRYFPELRLSGGRNATRRGAAERAAINAPIQGSAADILKIAMINLDKALRAAHLKSAMILQVHDELILEVPDDEIDAARALVKETMESVCELRVPLVVDVATGRSWLL